MVADALWHDDYDGRDLKEEKTEDFQWATLFNHCRAAMEPNDSGFWGRCDLKKHDKNTDHAFERGMMIVRWKTSWEDW